MKIVQGMDSDVLRNIEDFVMGNHLASKFNYLSSGINADVFEYEGLAVKRFIDGAKEQNDPLKMERLQDSVFYPTLFSYEPRKYMVTKLNDGTTIYNADGKNGDLLREYDKELEQAKLDARLVGLNPADVHLNNIMIDQNGHLQIIDVGRFYDDSMVLSSHGHRRRSHSHSHSYSHSYSRSYSSSYSRSSSSRRHRHGHGHGHGHRSRSFSISSVISDIFSS
jgi:hypothetical protein